MKINLAMKFEDIDGSNLKKDPARPDLGDVTVFDVLKQIAVTELAEDSQGAGPDVIKRKTDNFDFFLRVRDAGPDCSDFEISSEDVVAMKFRLCKIYSAIVSGPLCRAFEGKDPYGRKPVRAAIVENAALAPTASLD